MNEDQRRRIFQKLKSMSSGQFWNQMNILHSRAYAAAERHYGEAMDIVLTPKQKQAVLSKATQIREEWDGMVTVDTDATEAELFSPFNSEAK